jgi:hypothetical protein
MRIFFLFSIVCLLQASSCKRSKDECPATFLNKGDDRLTIVNNSLENINFIFTYDYPADTNNLSVFVPTVQSINGNPAYNVNPSSSKKFRVGGCWESLFRTIPSGKLFFLIFNIDSIKAYPAAEIISRGLYKSYLYTLDELKANNWQVVYP